VEIKIEAQTVISNEGGFEPHPESYTPRVFAAIMPPVDSGAKVYEILQNGQAIPWPCLPVLEGFDYWVIYVDHLSDVDMRRAPKKAEFGASTQKAIDDAQIAHRQYQQDPVSQADIRKATAALKAVQKTVLIHGKEYVMIDPVPQADGFSESGNPKLDHLPEGSH
jgi:hypothetical protein